MNSFLTEVRQKFPDDKRSDADMLFDAGENYPDQLKAKYPDAWTEYESMFKAPTVVPNDGSSDFVRGAKVSLSQIKPLAEGVVGLGGATLEKAVGKGGVATAIKDWGLHGYQDGMAKTQDLARENDDISRAWTKAKDGDIGALIDWAQYGLGYFAGQAGETIAVSALGGLVGGAAGSEVPGAGNVAGAAGGAAAGLVAKGTVKAAARNLIEKAIARQAVKMVTAEGAELSAEQIAKQALNPAIRKAAAKEIGSTIAITANGLGMELGTIYPEAEAQAQKEGRELTGTDLARVWGTGIAAGGIEALTDKLGIDLLKGKFAGKLGGSRLVSGAVGAAAGAGVEGGTELAQTALERVGAGQSLTDADAQSDYLNSAALGALGGGAAGGIGGAVHPTKPEPEAIPPAKPNRTASPAPDANAINPAEMNYGVANLTPETKATLTALAAREASGENTPELIHAIESQARQYPDRTEGAIRAVFYKGELQRLKAERAEALVLNHTLKGGDQDGQDQNEGQRQEEVLNPVPAANTPTAPISAPAVPPSLAPGTPTAEELPSAVTFSTGTPITVTAYRGVGPANLGKEGGPKFFSESKEEAASYGKVQTAELNLENPLVSENWIDAKKKLGLPANAAMDDIFAEAAKQGHDGVTWVHHGKREFVVLPETAVEPDMTPEVEAAIARQTSEPTPAQTTTTAITPAPVPAAPVGAGASPSVDTSPLGVPFSPSVELTDRVDVAKYAGRDKEGGVGKQGSEAFTETDSPDKLYEDSKASASDNGLSHKTAVLESPDGSHVVAGTAYVNRGKRYVTFIKNGKPSGVQFEQLTGLGYKLVAAIKTDQPTKGYATVMRQEQWTEAATKLREDQRVARNEAAGGEEIVRTRMAATASGAALGASLTGESTGDDVGNAEAVAPEVVTYEIKGFTTAHAGAIFDAVKGATSEDDVVPFIAESRQAIKAFELALKAITKGGAKPQQALIELKAKIYEAYNEAGGSKEAFAESFRGSQSQTGTGAAQKQGAESGSADRGSGGESAGQSRSGQGTETGEDAGSKNREVEEAASVADPNPTEAQKEAGNYTKGHVEIAGLDVAIENAKGSVRSGTGPDGPWSVVLTAHYGYVKGTEGRDGDQVDVYIGPNPGGFTRVWVVDQINPKTKKFDEHKALIGFNSQAEALATYVSAFSDNSGPQRIGEMTEMTRDDFVDWVNEGNTEKPLSYGKKRFSERGKFDSSPSLVYLDADGEPTSHPENQLRPEERLGGALHIVEGGNDGGTGARASAAERAAELEAYARENGLVLDPEVFTRTVIDGRKELGDGAEHTVWFDRASKRVIKLTHRALTLGGEELLNVGEYLRSLDLMNKVFGDSIRLEGLVTLEGEDSPRIVISQPHIKGREATFREIDAFMRAHGFTPAEPAVKGAVDKAINSGKIWRKGSLVVSDAVPRNVMAQEKKDGSVTIVPFDVMIEDTSSRHSVRQTTPIERSESSLLAKFNEIIERAQVNGMDVSVLQAAVREGGSWSPGEVTLSLFDMMNPTADNLVLAIHETVGHPAFDSLTDAQKLMLQNAFAKLAAETNPKMAPGVNAEMVRSEEYLVERASQALVNEGFTPTEAAGILQLLSRVLRDLYLRVAMAFQTSVLGKDHVSPALAEAWFQNRMKAFMAGDKHVSFLSWIGGPRMTMQQLIESCLPTQGSGGLSAQFNYETGGMEYAPVLADSVGAVRLNLMNKRYSVREPANPAGPAFVKTGEATVKMSPLLVEIDVAAANELHAAQMNLFKAFESAGLNTAKLTFEQFREFLLADADPQAVIAELNAALASEQQTPVDPSLRAADLISDVSQVQAADKGYLHLWRLNAKLAEKRKAAEATLKTVSARMARVNTMTNDLMKARENADLYLRALKERLPILIESFGRGVTTIGRQSHEAGMLEQVIGNLEGDVSRQRLVSYRGAIDKLNQRLTDATEGQKFTDTLEAVARLNIDWKNETATDIRKQIELAFTGTNDPLFAPLMDKGQDGRARLAVAIAFGKSEAHVLELLATRKNKAWNELAVLSGALKKVMSVQEGGLEEARTIAAGLKKNIPNAVRLIDRFAELRREQKANLDELQRAKIFREFHDNALPGLLAQITQLEQAVGAQSSLYEANDGSVYLAAVRGQLVERTLKLDNIEGNEQVLRDIQANAVWLDSVPEEERGARWMQVKAMTDKLKDVAAIAGHEKVARKSIVNKLLGSLPDRLQSTGIPSLQAAARMMRTYLSDKHAAFADAEVNGEKWMNAMLRAKKALGMEKVDNATFDQMFFQSARSFAEKNPDIRASVKTDAEGFEKLLPLLREHLASSQDLAQAMARPGAWAALEKWYRETYAVDTYYQNFHKQRGLKIKEVLPDGSVIYRDMLGSTFFTATRRTNGRALRMYHLMRELGWLQTKESQPLKRENVAELFEADPQALDESLQALFTLDVWRDFVTPLANMEGRSAFYGPTRTDGMTLLANRENVAQAFRSANGNALAFARALYQLEGQQRDTIETEGEFVGRTIAAFREYFDSLHNELQERDANPLTTPSTPRLLVDARTSEQRPGEWLEYVSYGPQELHRMTDVLLKQAHFGLRLEGMRENLRQGIAELENRNVEYQELLNRLRRENLGINKKKLLELAKAELAKDGKSFMAYDQAAWNLELARTDQTNYETLMHLDGGLAMETRPFLELIKMMAGMTVQGPGTAILQMSDFGAPFAKLGMGPAAMRVLASSVNSFAAGHAGTLAQVFHRQIGWNADKVARRVRNGYKDPDAYVNFKAKWDGMVQDETSANNAFTKGMFKTARAGRAVLSSGLGRAQEGAATSQVTLKPHAIFSMEMMQQLFAFVDGWTGAFEDMVERAVKYYEANPEDRVNPEHQFTKLTDLGYSKGFMGIGSDARAYDFLYNAMARYGVNLEITAKEVIARRREDSEAPALTDEQFRRLAAIVQNEITLDSNPASGASWMFNNPIGRLAAPLISWSMRKSHDVWENTRRGDMTQHESIGKALHANLLPYLALMPIALAMAWFRDKYDEELLQKKANRAQAGTLYGTVDALGRVGTFGMAGDVFNSVLNRDTERKFTVDNRVFFISSGLNAVRAMQNWYQQGSADYASVGRPLIQAFGGSGYIQYAQILNTATGGVLESERRITARINAGNYLRVAGRELGLDVRVSSGADITSNPVRPLVGQMALAALANDAGDFRAAYTEALKVALREETEDNLKRSPADRLTAAEIRKEAYNRVRQGFSARNPVRSVFQSMPTEAKYRQVLDLMPDDGALAVEQAVRLFDAYAAQVINENGKGIPATFSRDARKKSGTSLVPSLTVALPKLGMPVSLEQARLRAVAY